VIARVWGPPSLAGRLRDCGIVCRDAGATVAVIGIDQDTDLEMVRQLAMFPILAIVAAARTPDNARRIVEAIELGVLTVLPADAPSALIAATVIGLAMNRSPVDGHDVHPFIAEMLDAPEEPDWATKGN